MYAAEELGVSLVAYTVLIVHVLCTYNLRGDNNFNRASMYE